MQHFAVITLLFSKSDAKVVQSCIETIKKGEWTRLELFRGCLAAKKTFQRGPNCRRKFQSKKVYSVDGVQNSTLQLETTRLTRHTRAHTHARTHFYQGYNAS